MCNRRFYLISASTGDLTLRNLKSSYSKSLLLRTQPQSPKYIHHRCMTVIVGCFSCCQMMLHRRKKQPGESTHLLFPSHQPHHSCRMELAYEGILFCQRKDKRHEYECSHGEEPLKWKQLSRMCIIIIIIARKNDYKKTSHSMSI